MIPPSRDPSVTPDAWRFSLCVYIDGKLGWHCSFNIFATVNNYMPSINSFCLKH